jgi:hypothetical protein
MQQDRKAMGHCHIDDMEKLNSRENVPEQRSNIKVADFKDSGIDYNKWHPLISGDKIVRYTVIVLS